MLKLLPNHFKSQKMCRNAARKWSLAIIYVSDSKDIRLKR